jgi:carbon-monoxide dehydrogenase medium subunit
MKPAPFSYRRAGSLEEVVSLLGEHGPDVRVLAGGQSLIPMLNLRVARPGLLLDIGPLTVLNRLGTDDGHLLVGALVPHAVLETAGTVRSTAPVLARAAGHIGHPAIRRRGTIGGSLAHGDPSAELIAVATALDASVTLDSRAGRRDLAVSELVDGPYETAIEPDELLTWVQIPRPKPGAHTGFYEMATRHGDFAIMGAVWHTAGDRTRVAVFGGDVGHVLVDVPAELGPQEVSDVILEGRPLPGLAADRLRTSVARAAEDAGVGVG